MFLNALEYDDAAKSIIKSRAEPSRAEPSRAEPSRAEPSRAEPSRASDIVQAQAVRLNHLPPRPPGRGIETVPFGTPVRAAPPPPSSSWA